MQFSKVLALAAFTVGIVSAAPTPFTPDPVNDVQLFIESENNYVNGKGLYHLHEGAAIDYVFLGEGASTFKYDYQKDIISANVGDYEFYFSVAVGAEFPSLQVSAGSSYYTKWSIEDGYLTGNGSSNYFVAKNTGDPYNYLKDIYQVGLFPEGAFPAASTTDVDHVKIKVLYVQG